MDRYVLKIIQIRALLILGLTFGISAGFGLWSEPQYIAYAEPIMEDTEWDDVTVELKPVKRASGDTITLPISDRRTSPPHRCPSQRGSDLRSAAQPTISRRCVRHGIWTSTMSHSARCSELRRRNPGTTHAASIS